MTSTAARAPGEGIPDDLRGDPLPSCGEMRAWDEETIKGGVPGLELMERAGQGVVEALLKRFDHVLCGRRPVVVLVGPGNNGGDGLVVARRLRERGSIVTVIAAASEQYSPDYMQNVARLVESDVDVVCIGTGAPPLPGIPQSPFDGAALTEILSGAALVIDALLGTGQSRPLSGVIESITQALGHLQLPPPVVSIDVPTGIDGDTGVAHPGAVRADFTVAIGYVKRGLTQYPARRLAGIVERTDIGIKAASRPMFCSLRPEAHRLPPREPDCHKGDFGHALIVGGSATMPGAAELAARAALRTGAGWVSKTVIAGVPVVETPEVMLVPLAPRPSGALELGDFNSVRGALERATAVLIGPGIGLATATAPLVHAVLGVCRERGLPVVIDGDALTFLARTGARVDLSGWVVTPHPGEMARLVDRSTVEVQRDRFGEAHRLADRSGAVVVLKGAGSVVATRSGGVVCDRGTPYLATPGSGDVLGGIIVSLLAQGMSAAESAARGVAIHAVAGERAQSLSGGTIIAADIIESIPGVVGATGGDAP